MSQRQDVDYRKLALSANSIRESIIRMIATAGSGHPGGSLSCADILAVLYLSGVSSVGASANNNSDKDRFILSKGHAAPALYAVLHELGQIETHELASIRTLGSRLQGHPDSKLLPGVEVCTGSLGQGLSVGVGMALGLALANSEAATRTPTVYVLCGDGELQEGSVWESLMYAAHRHLNNLVLLVDKNGLQIDGTTDEVCSLGDLNKKLSAFGWNVREIDGHDLRAIHSTLSEAKDYTNSPSAIICHTLKGKGVSFMEGKREWHGKAPNEAQLDQALEELARQRAALGEGTER